MSAVITEELRLLGACILFGMGIGAAYELPRLSRLLFRHGRLWTGIEDLIFWAMAAAAVFGMILRTNDGAIRWYALAGCVGGAGLYQAVFHRLLAYLLTPVGQIIKKVQNSRRNRLKRGKKSAKLKENTQEKVQEELQEKTGEPRREVQDGRIRKKEEEREQDGHAGH